MPTQTRVTESGNPQYPYGELLIRRTDATSPFRANTTGSRRRPYPYDLYIDNVRCLLEPDQDGTLVSQDSKTLSETAPIDYTYSSANPYKERTSEFQKLFAGFGQAVCPDDVPRRYYYAEKADLSVDGLWMKGPAFEKHVVQLGTATHPPGEVRQFIQALHNAVVNLFVVCQNGVWRYDSPTDTWVESLTLWTSPGLAAGMECHQAVRFFNRGTNPVDALYLGTNLDNLWRHRQINPADSNSWAWERAALAAGPPGGGSGTGATVGIAGNGQARYVERLGNELWVAGDYWISKVEDDPFDRTKYSAPIAIGDQHARTTWLKQINDVLYTFKEDGIYSVSTEGEDQDLFATLRGKNDLRNGRNASIWLDRMWFTFGNQTFTLNSAGQLRPDGLEQMLENTSPVRGRWIDGAGHNTWFFYEVYYNEIDRHSYLVKHGTWVEEPDVQKTVGVAQFAEAHHGALYDWPYQRATCLEVIAGADISGNDRLMVGFSDGTIQWTILPRNSPNPTNDQYCEFTTQPSYVYLPQHHSRFRADYKLWHAMTAFGPHLTETEWVTIEYRTDVTDPSAQWIPVDPTDSRFTLNGQRHNLTDNEVQDPRYGRSLLMRIKLDKYPETTGQPDTPYSNLNETPVLEGIAVHESIRPAFSREYAFSIKLGSFLPLRNGTVDRRRSEHVQQVLLQICAKIGPVDVLLPTGALERMTIVNYEDSLISRQKYRDFIWVLKIHALQLRTITVGAEQVEPGVATGLTYATLETYTVGQLEGVI
jgi:hypothetical protein